MKKSLLVFILFSIVLFADTAYNKGRKSYQNEEYFKALKYFYVSARKHNTNAYLELAIMYEKGIGTEVNTMTALYWYQKASNRGNLYAKNRLSTLKVTPLEKEEESIIWSLGNFWSEQTDMPEQSEETLDENKTSIWYWSDLWDKEEENLTKESEEQEETQSDSDSIWSSISLWDKDDNSSVQIDDTISDKNESSLWSSIKFWDTNESKSTKSVKKPRRTNQEILMGEEEW